MSGVLKKWKLILAVFLITVFWTAAGMWLIRSQSDKDRASEQIEQTKELAPVSEVEIPKADSEEIETEESEIKLLEVDLAKLIAKNSDTTGWIQVVGTNIDYPFVQTSTDYYRNHSFDKSRNSAGWPYLDKSNAKDLSDAHSIIYLHGEIEGSEFEPARSVIASTSWINDPEGFVVRTSTESANAIWQVFSIYKIETTDDYLKPGLQGSELLELVEKLKSRSVYNFEVPFTESDRMLTFSIKYDDKNIVAIHAKLAVLSEKGEVKVIDTPGTLEDEPPEEDEDPETPKEESPEDKNPPEDSDEPSGEEISL